MTKAKSKAKRCAKPQRPEGAQTGAGLPADGRVEGLRKLRDQGGVSLVSLDPEVAAMQEVGEAVRDLNEEARARVLHYIAERFGVPDRKRPARVVMGVAGCDSLAEAVEAARRIASEGEGGGIPLLSPEQALAMTPAAMGSLCDGRRPAECPNANYDHCAGSPAHAAR